MNEIESTSTGAVNEIKSNKHKARRENILCLIIVLVIFTFIALPFILRRPLVVKVTSDSMLPTLQVKSVYQTKRLSTERGNIVIFENNAVSDKQIVKRLIGLPGDEVFMSNGDLFINNEKIDEPYVKYNDLDYIGHFIIPEGYCFVLGDNRVVSYDSRYWEQPFIKLKDLICCVKEDK